MSTFYGFRNVVVFEDATEGDFGTNSYGRRIPLVIEVTNHAEEDATYIYINDNPEGGQNAVGIPIPAKSTRQIPMQVYWFRADTPVTVVGYLP